MNQYDTLIQLLGDGGASKTTASHIHQLIENN